MCGIGKGESKYKTPACLKNVPNLVVEEFPVTSDGYTYKWGRIAYIKGSSPKPVILVHHNYAGLKQFDIDQACFLALSGFVGLAVDCYKETEAFTYEDRGLEVGRHLNMDEFVKAMNEENIFEKPAPAEYKPDELKVWFEDKDLFVKETGRIRYQLLRHFIGAFTQMQRLLSSPGSWRRLMEATLEKAFQHPAVMPGEAAGIGYCLGGQSCLEQLRAGHNLKAIVSFHGLLHSRPMYPDDPWNSLKRIKAAEYQKQFPISNNYNKDCIVLIENGANDEEVPPDTIVEFMSEMDGQMIDWRFENHARGPHGFALAPGCPGGDLYTECIDRRSSIAMFSLFAEVWPDVKQYPVECNACGTKLGQQIVTKTKGWFGISGVQVKLAIAVSLAGVAILAAVSEKASWNPFEHS